MKNPIPEMIREYAHLQHQSEIYQAHQTKVPANIALRMSALLAWGRANIHPNSFPAAIQEVNGIVANLHMQRGAMEQQQNTGSNRKLLDNAVRKVTKGMLGQPHLTANQLAAIVNKDSLRARIPNRRPTQAEADAAIKAITRRWDPKSVGWGAHEYRRRMDELTDAMDEDPEQFSKLCFKYNDVDPSEVRRECVRWKTVRTEIALKERQIERDKTRGKIDNPMLNKGDRKVSDSEHRKATLTTNLLADAIDQSERGDSTAFNGLTEQSDIHPSYLEDRGRRGEMARAFEKHDRLEYSGGET